MSATFFGQPRALGFLAFTEAWERFSYYGMTSLLVLYMSQALFLPGHVEGVAGFAAYAALFGNPSPLALASQTYGLYTGFVYFTPVLGGWIADRFLGRKRAVMAGAVLMSCGHFAMAFDASFLLALLLLIVGCGLLKGNISTQVGQLYAEDDAEGRARGFSIFSMGINVGAVAGPVTCGLLAQVYGWHAGFALAGALMLIALATYVIGYRYVNEAAPAARARTAAAPMTRRDWTVVAALFGTMALTVFHSIAYYQNGNIGLVWLSAHADWSLFGVALPPSWFTAFDAFVSIVSVPPLIALWRWQARHGGEPDELAKIATGAALASAANLVLAFAAASFVRAPGILPLLYEVLLGVAFLYQWPTLLALVSRAAPAQIKATLMGGAFLSLFVSNVTLGRIGTLYEHMTPAEFWLMNAAIAAAGALLAMILRAPLMRVFDEATR
jgi:POT family proton-dependent oligopeptide transporter